MICSKNVTFAVATTISSQTWTPSTCCDLLKKCYLCSSNNNLTTGTSTISPVVICSKNVTFAVATTILFESAVTRHGCDLLKKCYLCSSNNNETDVVLTLLPVVICSKNVTFAVATTIERVYCIWTIRCDLLKKCYLCSSNNNHVGIDAVRLKLWFAQKMLPLQ